MIHQFETGRKSEFVKKRRFKAVVTGRPRRYQGGGAKDGTEWLWLMQGYIPARVVGWSAALPPNYRPGQFCANGSDASAFVKRKALAQSCKQLLR